MPHVASTSRASSLLLLLALALAACASPLRDIDAALPDTGPPVDTGPCPSAGTTFCNGRCTIVSLDPTNCGSCGTVCRVGEVCSDGMCTLSCAGGTVRCGAQCIDPLTNLAHCGATDPCTGASAGHACAPGQVCFNGSCQITCGPGFLFCNGRCVDPLHDAQNCGASGDCMGSNAGTSCPAGQACNNGVCQVSCPPGQVNCSGSCIDPTTSPSHCGAHDDCMGANAGMACSAGQVCNAGTCASNCPTNEIACMGSCVDPTTDRNFCGASMDCAGANVGHVCGAGQICMGGACVTSCTSGQVVCGGMCIDPLTDRSYCGASGSCTGASAGSACGSGQVCMGGSCMALPCPTGQIACGTGCVDPNINPQFCGATGDCTGTHAGTVCRPDQYCSGGRCNETFGRYSYLSPGTNLTDQTRARPTRYEIGTAFPANIFWTLDGSTPRPGAAGTRMNPSPLDLGVLNDGANVHWYADFGPPMGPEPIVHQLAFHVNAGGTHSSSQIVEGLRVTGGYGPVAVVAHGTVFTLSASAQYWHADSMGYCPGCIVYFSINFAGQDPAGAPFCANNSVTWTGTTASGTATFTAPSTPGRYPILANNALDFHCDPGGEEIGEVFVF